MTQTPAERRKALKEISLVLKRELNDAQRETLHSLEQFGWELKFVRRKMFQPPVAFVSDADSGGKILAVLEPDGSVNESPGLEMRNDSEARRATLGDPDNLNLDDIRQCSIDGSGWTGRLRGSNPVGSSPRIR